MATFENNKRFLAKIFQKDGSMLSLNIPHGSIKELPTFSDRINGGMGECIIDFKTPFDNFSEGVKIVHQFVLDLIAFDEANPLGRRIYRGTIQEYEPYLDGAQQGVKIKAIGLASNLSYDAYMASSRSNYTVTHTTVDPETIFKAIIDEWRATANNDLINYAVGSTQAVGTNVTKEFIDRLWFDACSDVKDLCGTGWWWHVDENGTAYLLPKPSTPTHKFIIGKHIHSANFPKSAKSIKNRIRVTRSGGTVTHYSDAPSTAAFESRLEIINDTTLGSLAAADQRGNKAMNDSKNPRVKATMIINSKYDLESIKVGQTCSVLNSDGSASFFGSNVMITGLQYNGNTVELELEESVNDLGLAFQKLIDS